MKEGAWGIQGRVFKTRGSGLEPMPCSFAWKRAGLRCPSERLCQGSADSIEFLWSHQRLQPFEKLAFLFTDVSGQFLDEILQARDIQGARFRPGKQGAQDPMLDAQLADQGLQFGKTLGCWKDFFFLGFEMNADLLLKLLLDLGLPGLRVYFARLQSAVQPHAQRQSMLVLMGEGNEILVAQHAATVPARRGAKV